MTKTNRIENNMKFVRLSKHKTLDELFLETKIWQARLSRIERGIFAPRPEEKRKIARALDSKIVTVFPES